MKCLSVQPGGMQHGTVVDHVRLFRNRPDIRWKYRVHEQILPASLDGSQPGDSIVKKLFALLAQAHHRLGQRNEALAACRAGRARYPEDPELLYLEGIFHRERREWGQAIGCLQKLVGRKEENNRRERGEGAEKTIHEAKQSAEASPLPSVSSAFSAVKNSENNRRERGERG